MVSGVSFAEIRSPLEEAGGSGSVVGRMKDWTMMKRRDETWKVVPMPMPMPMLAFSDCGGTKKRKPGGRIWSVQG